MAMLRQRVCKGMHRNPCQPDAALVAQVALEDAYEWSTARCIMDVGGGRGEMLSRGMACAGPDCRGILMDRPWVLDRCVQTQEVLHGCCSQLRLRTVRLLRVSCTAPCIEA